MPVSLRHTLTRLLLPCLLALAVAACSFPGVYHLTVQQGNVVTQDMVNQLQPGMDKRQVRFIMGTPLLIDSFEDSRWDYFYSLKNGNNEYSRSV
ncbi:MAG: outer membrane protein assembly factor BamE [Pseudomonadales bacterium]